MFQVVYGVCITLLFSSFLRAHVFLRAYGRGCTPDRTDARVRENVRFDFR